MIDHRTAPYAVLLLRVVTGILFLAHAGAKIFIFTVPGFVKYFASLGLPEWFAYMALTLEVLGGLALILGVYARLVAIPLGIEILGTIVMVHGARGFYFNNNGGGWEFPALWAVALFALVLLGDGAYALRPTFGKGRKSAA
jgi:putative oxidoreductase